MRAAAIDAISEWAEKDERIIPDISASDLVGNTFWFLRKDGEEGDGEEGEAEDFEFL